MTTTTASSTEQLAEFRFRLQAAEKAVEAAQQQHASISVQFELGTADAVALDKAKAAVAASVEARDRIGATVEHLESQERDEQARAEVAKVAALREESAQVAAHAADLAERFARSFEECAQTANDIDAANTRLRQINHHLRNNDPAGAASVAVDYDADKRRIEKERDERYGSIRQHAANVRYRITAPFPDSSPRDYVVNKTILDVDGKTTIADIGTNAARALALITEWEHNAVDELDNICDQSLADASVKYSESTALAGLGHLPINDDVLAEKAKSHAELLPRLLSKNDKRLLKVALDMLPHSYGNPGVISRTLADAFDMAKAERSLAAAKAYLRRLL